MDRVFLYPLKVIDDAFRWRSSDGAHEENATRAEIASLSDTQPGLIWSEQTQGRSSYMCLLVMAMIEKIVKGLLGNDHIFSAYGTAGLVEDVRLACGEMPRDTNLLRLCNRIFEMAVTYAINHRDGGVEWPRLARLRTFRDGEQLPSELCRRLMSVSTESHRVLRPERVMATQAKSVGTVGHRIDPHFLATIRNTCRESQSVSDATFAPLDPEIPLMWEASCREEMRFVDRFVRRNGMSVGMNGGGGIDTTGRTHQPNEIVTPWHSVFRSVPIMLFVLVYTMDLLISSRIRSYRYATDVITSLVSADAATSSVVDVRSYTERIVMSIEDDGAVETYGIISSALSSMRDVQLADWLLVHAEAHVEMSVANVLLLWMYQAHRDVELVEDIVGKPAFFYRGFMASVRAWFRRFMPGGWYSNDHFSSVVKRFATGDKPRADIPFVPPELVLPDSPMRSVDDARNIHHSFPRTRDKIHHLTWMMSLVKSIMYKLSDYQRAATMKAYEEIERDRVKNRSTAVVVTQAYFMPLFNKADHMMAILPPAPESWNQMFKHRANLSDHTIHLPHELIDHHMNTDRWAHQWVVFMRRSDSSIGLPSMERLLTRVIDGKRHRYAGTLLRCGLYLAAEKIRETAILLELRHKKLGYTLRAGDTVRIDTCVPWSLWCQQKLAGATGPVEVRCSVLAVSEVECFSHRNGTEISFDLDETKEYPRYVRPKFPSTFGFGRDGSPIVACVNYARTDPVCVASVSCITPHQFLEQCIAGRTDCEIDPSSFASPAEINVRYIFDGATERSMTILVHHPLNSVLQFHGV